MRSLARNCRPVWYANYEMNEEIIEDGQHTGRRRTYYTNVQMIWVNKSTTSGLTNNNISGKVRRHPYGEELDYNVTINPIPDTCDISEQSVLWVDTAPVINQDGSTDTPYDHVITRISYSLGWRALQAVKVDRSNDGLGPDEEETGDP